MGLIRDLVEATISARGHDIGTRTDEQQGRGGKEATLYLPSRGILGTSSRSVGVAQPRKKTRFDE